MLRKSLSALVLLILLSLVLGPLGNANAQTSDPTCPLFESALMHDKDFVQSLPSECTKAYQKLTRNEDIQANTQDVLPLAIGGPDAFGYTYDDAVVYNWISATTNSGLIGDDYFAGPINIGFNFPFYGITQTQLYFNTNGLITFGAESNEYYNTYIPGGTSLPNNLVAAFWDDLAVGSPYNSGAIYYSQGGIAPNRYFVVEWRNITTLSNTSSVFSFEAILYENGNIVVQHKSLPASYESTIGIENSVGDEGLQYQYGSSGLSAPKAIRFYYPTSPTARLMISPLEAGRFSVPEGTADFVFTVINTGNMGADTYDVTASSIWPVTFYAANGVTPLVDTDINGTVDTGSVSQGNTVTIIAKVATPAGAVVGDANITVINVRSSLDISKSKVATLQSAVPAPFAQVYEDDTDGAMSLDLVEPNAQIVKKATADDYYGCCTVVTAAPNGNLVYLWNKSRYTGTVSVTDIEYTLLDHYGNTVRAVSQLVNNSGATITTLDSSPSVAIAPNGTIGVAWYRYLYNPATSQFNSNIYFATLDVSGNMIYGPANITNNTVWGTSSDLNVPCFYSPTIAASDDNRFSLAWEKYIGDPSYTYNIWYATRNTAGTSVFPPTALTSDNMSFGSVLNNLSGGKTILTWLTGGGGPYYAVISSSGAITKTATSLNAGNMYWSPDAVLLPNGKVSIAWATSTGVQFAILNSSYILESGPTSANSPSSVQGAYLSMTTDPFSRVIMTWSDSSSYQNLFYALGDSTGAFITQPMIYKTSASYFETSDNGQGNSLYTTTTISGNAGAAGVTLSYTDGTAKTVTSQANGSYSLRVSNNWSGTMTPTHPCFTFSPANISYVNVVTNQTSQNYTPTIIPASGCANVNVDIGGVIRGIYGIPAQGSMRQNYAGLDSGPVKVASTNGVPIIAAIRDAWAVNGVTTSFSQLMGLPLSQVSDKYVFPGYNNVTLNEQLRIANVDTVQTTVTVRIGGVLQGTYTLYPPGSLLGPSAVRVNYPGLDSGPVIVEGTAGVDIISAIRDAWAVNGVTKSFIQFMGLPAGQLSNKYVFPAYNNVTLNEQLRIANVDTVQTIVTVTIGGVLQGTYTLYPPGSLLGPSAVRVNYPGLDSGPVIVEGTAGVDIISSLRDAWAVNGVTTSFSQLMGVPAEQLSNKYIFPAYNNVTLNDQLRISNVDTAASTVVVTIGGVPRGTYTLYPPGSLLGPSAVRINYAGLDSGPVVVEGTAGVEIISAIREAWAVNGVTQSFVQLMGLPAGQLSTTFLFPAYNNVTLNEQLRIGIP